MLGTVLALGALVPAADARAAALPTMDDDPGVPTLDDSRPYVGGGIWIADSPTWRAGCWGYSYDWFRDGQALPPSTGPVIVPTSEDLGHTFSAVVTAYGGCDTKQVTTASSRPVEKQRSRSYGFTGRNALELLARQNDGTLKLYLGSDADASWEEPRTVGPGWDGLRIIPAGDIDSDGITDLYFITSDGRLYIGVGTGDGGFHTDLYPSRPYGWGWDIFDDVSAPGDFNGDGFNDVLAREPGGALYFYGLNLPGKPRVQVGQGWNVMDAIITPGDFDGDSNVDILARDKATGQLHLYPGDGHGGWKTPHVVGWGWQSMAKIGSAGDFNHDGFDDVWAVDPTGGLFVYYSNGSGGWKGVEQVGWGWNIFNAVL